MTDLECQFWEHSQIYPPFFFKKILLGIQTENLKQLNLQDLFKNKFEFWFQSCDCKQEIAHFCPFA